MENASKALIIAGAILLAIAIIGIGMYVYNNAADAMSGTDMTDEQVRTYNQTFTNYSGTQRGANVKTMCETIANHNRTAEDASELVQVLYDQEPNENNTFDASQIDTSMASTQHINQVKNNDVQSGVSYVIDFGYDSTSGRVTTVYIMPIESNQNNGGNI